MKAILNRCVFRRDLKCPRDDAFLIFAGNLFHKVGAATLNAQSPYDLSRDTGISHIISRNMDRLISLFDLLAVCNNSADRLVPQEICRRQIKITSLIITIKRSFIFADFA